MADDLRRILSRADADLLVEWGQRHGANWATPPPIIQRSAWVASTLPALFLEQQDVRARLAREAEDIADLGQASRQFLFVELIRDRDVPPDAPFNGSTPESISLWLWLRAQEAFEKALRRTRVLHQMTRPRLCSRYECLPNPLLEVSDTGLGPFEAELKQLYRDHDMSGEEIELVRDWELDADGRRVAVTVHAAVSRQLTLEASFDAAGNLRDVPLRRPTNWRCRFDLDVGQLTLICDRGGRVLRDASADAFVMHVLRQSDPPVAIDAPKFDLERLMSSDGLPAIDGVSALTPKAVRVVHPSFPDDEFEVVSGTDAWAPLQLLTQAPPGDLGPCKLISVRMEARFAEGTGSAKRAEKSITFDVYATGTTSLTRGATRERLLFDILVPFLSNRAEEDALAA